MNVETARDPVKGQPEELRAWGLGGLGPWHSPSFYKSPIQATVSDLTSANVGSTPQSGNAKRGPEYADTGPLWEVSTLSQPPKP